MVTIKTLSTNLPFLPRFTLLPPLPQGCRRTGDGQLRVRSWSVCNISSLLPSPPHYCPTPAWGLLYGIQSLINCFEVDPPLAGVVLQKEPVPARIPCGPQFLPETCSCVGSSNCSFLQGSSFHLLSVGAPRLPLWGSAPACSTVRCRWRACFPLSKRTELPSRTTAVRC